MTRWELLLACVLSAAYAGAAPAVKTVTLTDYPGGGWQDERPDMHRGKLNPSIHPPSRIHSLPHTTTKEALPC